MVKKLQNLLLFSFLLLFGYTHAQLTVAGNITGATLANNLFGPGVTISNLTVNCGSTQYGTFNATSTNLGLTNGILLTTGDIGNAIGPNNTGSAGTDLSNTSNDACLGTVKTSSLHDPCIVAFDIVPSCDTFNVSYVFGSEEYPEFVNAGYNDAFGFFINGPKPGGGTYSCYNVARVPGTATPVTIDNVNSGSNSAYYRDNTNPGAPNYNTIQYDGLTVPLIAVIPVIPCNSYHMELAIVDQGDGIYDSGVFLEYQGLRCVADQSLAVGPKVSTICSGTPVTLTASGMATYTWSPATGLNKTTGATVIATATATTKYVVTGSNGCGTEKDSVTINVTPGPSVTVTPSAPSYCSGGSVSLTASATGGTTYTWSPAVGLSASTGATVLANPTTTTTYTVSTTISGCTGTKTVVVTVNPTPTISLSAPPTICSGNSTTLTASGATTYSWSTAATTSSISVSPATTTTYTVNGSTGGCPAAPKTIVVTVNTTPTLTASASPTVLCSGNPTTITASGATTYSWSTGATTSAITVSPATTTTYTVNGTSTGCPAAPKTVVVTVNPTPTLNATAGSPTICSGNSTTLTGSGAATYSWSTGATTSVISVSPVTTTTYTLNGTSAAGCPSASSKTVVVTVNTTPTLNIAPTSPTICTGGNVTLIGSGATTYTWSTGATTSTINVGPITTTTYTLNGSNAGCPAAPKTVVVTVASSLNVTVVPANPNICVGGSILLNASGAASFTWKPSAGLSCTACANPTANPAGTTTYTVVGTSGGCSDSTKVTVTVNPTPTISITISGIAAAICPGDSMGMKAAGGSTYTWSPATGLNCTTCANVYAKPGTTITYTVTGTSAAGCSSTASQVITVYPSPTVTVTPANPKICKGDTTSLTASGLTTYNWAPNIGLNTVTGPVVIANPSTTTTYTVSGKGTGGCKTKDSAIVTVNATPTVGVVPPTPATCDGSSIQFTASGASTYTWFPGAGLTSTTGSVVTANPGSTTTYTVVGTNAAGCHDTTNFTLTINPLPVITVNPPSPSVCKGDSVLLTAGGAVTYTWAPKTGLSSTTGTAIKASPAGTTTYTVTGTDASGCTSNTTVVITVGGIIVKVSPVKPSLCRGDSTLANVSGASTYTWSPSTGLNNTTGSSVMITPATTSTYTVVGSGGAGCTDTVSFVITVNALPSVSVTASSAVVCSKGNPATLNASGANTYTWSPSSGLSATTGASVKANPSGTITYTVTGKNAAGCTDTASIVITVVASPTMIVSAVGGDSLCKGQSKIITASGATSYVWSTSATTSSISVSPSGSATYTVIGDNGGCTDTAQISIYIYPKLQVNMTADTVCIGKTATIKVSASGGEQPYGYVWSNGLGTGAGPKSIIVTGSGYYACTVTDQCGASVTDSVNLITVPSPSAAFSASPDTIMGGEFVSFLNKNSGATKWYWTFGDGGSAVDSFTYYQYNVPGSYFVTLVVNNRYCSDTARDTILVTEGIYVPNVFTPNNDGVNDVFHVTAGGLKTYNIEIFNRWGEKVFEANSPNIDWAGTSMAGVDEADGTYYYMITATDYKGKAFNQNGYVQLIR